MITDFDATASVHTDEIFFPPYVYAVRAEELNGSPMREG
jgi:hypothetical protein